MFLKSSFTQERFRSTGAVNSVQGKFNTEISEWLLLLVGCFNFSRRSQFSCVTSSESSTVVCHRLVGLVVKASASRAEDPGFESRLPGFFWVESYQ